MDALSKITAVSMETVAEQSDLGFPKAPSMAELDGLGSQLLDALGETKKNVNEKSLSIEETLKRVDNLSPGELLKVQFELAEITLQQELISKGVTKSTQNVDTLLKAQ